MDWIDFSLFIIVFFPIVINDIKEKIIPNECIYFGIVLFFLKRVIERAAPIYMLVISTAVGFIFIFLLFFFSKGMIGLGDAKLSALLALVLGLPGWIYAIAIGSAAGILFSLIMMIRKEMKMNDKVPFAPFIYLGGITVYFMTDQISLLNKMIY
jgi:leader peptidase (prepilin peptidase)/N-methyltransferase